MPRSTTTCATVALLARLRLSPSIRTNLFKGGTSKVKFTNRKIYLSSSTGSFMLIIIIIIIINNIIVFILTMIDPFTWQSSLAQTLT